MACLLAREGKLLTDSGFIKFYLIETTEEMCPEEINLFNTITFLGRAIDQRVGDFEEQHW